MVCTHKLPNISFIPLLFRLLIYFIVRSSKQMIIVILLWEKEDNLKCRTHQFYEKITKGILFSFSRSRINGNHKWHWIIRSIILFRMANNKIVYYLLIYLFFSVWSTYFIELLCIIVAYFRNEFTREMKTLVWDLKRTRNEARILVFVIIIHLDYVVWIF